MNFSEKELAIIRQALDALKWMEDPGFPSTEDKITLDKLILRFEDSPVPSEPAKR